MEPQLLDTDTLSEVIRGRNPHVARHATAYLAAHGRFSFSIVTRYEVLRGLKARGAVLQQARFNESCRISTILPLTDDIVEVAADIYATLYRTGQLIGDADTLIAATALVHGLTLVTNNLEHFRRVDGLAIETWRE